MDAQPHPSYESRIPFDAERIGAAAVYCSDGRFGDQIDDLLHNGLKLPRYDRVAIPGGPACFLSHFRFFFEEQAAAAHLEFLIRSHELERVVLIAHQECAYYLQRLRIKPDELKERQLEDISAAARRVRAIASEVAVTAYYARLDEDRVRFERIELR